MLPNMLDLIESTNTLNKARGNLTMLLYGVAKTGKTRLAATIARLDYLERIYWFDIENGIDTIALMYQTGELTKEQVSKIIPIRVPDTRTSPLAVETMLKAICGSAAVSICHAHGKIACRDCTALKEKAVWIPFDYRALTDRDCIVIDSLSQFGTSTINAATLGKPTEYKLQLDDYGASQKWCYDLLVTLQAAQHCHIIAITHARLLEDEAKRTYMMPLMGSATTSANVAKYFNTVVYVEKVLKNHKATSSTTGTVTAQAGSRLGLVLEKQKDSCLATALVEADYFPKTAHRAE